VSTHQQNNVTFTLDEQGRLVARLDREQREARALLELLDWRWNEELELLTAPTDTSLTAAAVNAVTELQSQRIPAALELDRSTAPAEVLTEAELVFQQLTEVRQQADNVEQTEQTAPPQRNRPSYAQRYGTSSPEVDVAPGSYTMPL
jgi:hypothetical protein